MLGYSFNFGSCQPHAKSPNWNTTPCRLSTTAYQYIRKYPPYSEAFLSIRNQMTRHAVVTRDQLNTSAKAFSDVKQINLFYDEEG
jgi:hypothetical protein